MESVNNEDRLYTDNYYPCFIKEDTESERSSDLLTATQLLHGKIWI